MVASQQRHQPKHQYAVAWHNLASISRCLYVDPVSTLWESQNHFFFFRVAIEREKLQHRCPERFAFNVRESSVIGA